MTSNKDGKARRMGKRHPMNIAFWSSVESLELQLKARLCALLLLHICEVIFKLGLCVTSNKDGKARRMGKRHPMNIALWSSVESLELQLKARLCALLLLLICEVIFKLGLCVTSNKDGIARRMGETPSYEHSLMVKCRIAGIATESKALRVIKWFVH